MLETRARTHATYLYNTRDILIQHTRHIYTTHATYLYNTRDKLIQHTRQTYTTHATYLYNTRDILVQRTRHIRHASLAYLPNTAVSATAPSEPLRHRHAGDTHSHTSTRTPVPANYRRSIRTGGGERQLRAAWVRKLTKVAECRTPSLKIGVFYFFRAWAVLRSLAQARPAGRGQRRQAYPYYIFTCF